MVRYTFYITNVFYNVVGERGLYEMTRQKLCYYKNLVTILSIRVKTGRICQLFSNEQIPRALSKRPKD